MLKECIFSNVVRTVVTTILLLPNTWNHKNSAAITNLECFRSPDSIPLPRICPCTRNRASVPSRLQVAAVHPVRAWAHFVEAGAAEKWLQHRMCSTPCIAHPPRPPLCLRCGGPAAVALAANRCPRCPLLPSPTPTWCCRTSEEMSLRCLHLHAESSGIDRRVRLIYGSKPARRNCATLEVAMEGACRWRRP